MEFNPLHSLLPASNSVSLEMQGPNEDEYDMTMDDFVVTSEREPMNEVSITVNLDGIREGSESSEDLLVSEESEDTSMFDNRVRRMIHEPPTRLPTHPLSSHAVFERAERIRQESLSSPAPAPTPVVTSAGQTLAELFPEDCSMFETHLSQTPSVVSSRGKWPVASVMVLNVPSNALKGKGNARKISTLVRSSKGIPRIKLLELLSHTCFSASNEPEENKDGKKASNKKNAPSSSRDVLAELQAQNIGTGPMSAETRRSLYMILAQSELGGEDTDADASCPPGTFRCTFEDDTEGWVPCTTQYVEAVRSEGENAHLLALRFWFIIRDPKFDVTGAMDKILLEHKKGMEKAMRSRSQKSLRERYDSPLNWKVYRNVQHSKGYGKLLDDYFDGLPLSSRTESSIRGFPPLLAFAGSNEACLTSGLDTITGMSIRENQKTLSEYMDVSEDGTITLTGLLHENMSRGLRELERTELSPEKLCDIFAPYDVVKINPKTNDIIPLGYEAEEMDSQGDTLVEIRSLFETIDLGGDTADEILSNHGNFTDLVNRLKAKNDTGMYPGFELGSNTRGSWDNEEISEIETSNKALAYKEINHNIRIDLRKKYMVSDPDRYIAEMKIFTQRAAERLITDLKNFRDEKESWYDAVVKILEFGDSLTSNEFWPSFAKTCDNLGVFGDAMFQEYTAFIHAFRIQPGWKPRDLQKYLVINLNVLEYEFSLHLHALLSGAKETGKSFLLQKLIEMRIAGTIEKITTMTENSLTSDPRAFNYKTVVMEEAAGWCLGMDQDGKPVQMQSSVLKDILSSCTANSLRCNWENGETSRAATFAVMMTNFIFASNWGYPPKSSPLVSRLLVEDVAEDEGKKIPVSDVAFALTGKILDHLNDRVCKEKKVEQYLHLLVELFILAEVIDPKVNLDIPLFLMDDVFNHLKANHDVPTPSVRFREQFFKVCRVLTIQNAIRTAFFTETGQLKYQYKMEEEILQPEGIKTGRKVIKTTEEGVPIKKPFNMRNIVDAVAPRLWCTEDIFAYAMTMLEAHIVPKLESDVINALSLMIAETEQDHRIIRSKQVNPSILSRASNLRIESVHRVSIQESCDAATGSRFGLATQGVEEFPFSTGNYQTEKVWAKILDPDYYMIRFDSLEAFYRETAYHCGRGLCEMTVQTIIGELKERTLKVEPKPNLVQFELTDAEGMISMVIGDDPISKKFLEQRETKHKKKIPFLRIERCRKGHGYNVCIAKSLVKQDAIMATDSPTELEDYPTYQNAMKNALIHGLSYHTTRSRDIVLSKSYSHGPKTYHDLLDVIRVEPVPRIIYKRSGVVTGMMGDIFLYYSDSRNDDLTKETFWGQDTNVVWIDDNLELETARNHARWIGVEFDHSVLPSVQDEEIKRVRETNPKLFPNMTIHYPRDARIIVDTQGAKTVYVEHKIKEARTYEDIAELRKRPFMNHRKYSNYFNQQTGDNRFDEEFEKSAYEAVEDADMLGASLESSESREELIHRNYCENMGDAMPRRAVRKQITRPESSVTEVYTIDEEENEKEKEYQDNLRGFIPEERLSIEEAEVEARRETEESLRSIERLAAGLAGCNPRLRGEALERDNELKGKAKEPMSVVDNAGEQDGATDNVEEHRSKRKRYSLFERMAYTVRFTGRDRAEDLLNPRVPHRQPGWKPAFEDSPPTLPLLLEKEIRIVVDAPANVDEEGAGSFDPEKELMLKISDVGLRQALAHPAAVASKLRSVDNLLGEETSQDAFHL